MHDLVAMRQKRTGIRRQSTSSTSGDDEKPPTTEEEALTKAQEVNPDNVQRESIDERLAGLLNEAKAIPAKDKQGKISYLNSLMCQQPNKYAGFGYYFNVYSKNLMPMRLERIKSFMDKHPKMHDGTSYRYDPVVNALNFFYAPLEEMDTSEGKPLIDPAAGVPPRVGSPSKSGNIHWQWTGDMDKVEENLTNLVKLLAKGGFIHEPLANWLSQWVVGNDGVMKLLPKEAPELIDSAIRKALSVKKKKIGRAHV